MEMTINLAELGKSSAEGVEVQVARSIPEVEALRVFWSASPIHRDSDIDFFLMIIESYRK